MAKYENSCRNIFNTLISQHPELFQHAIRRHREYLSNLIKDIHNNTIAYGPLKGFKLSNHFSWDESNRGGMILGLYEQELLNEFLAIPSEYNMFIDIGAADGYYGVGVLINDIFETSLCYEISEKGRANIIEAAILNNVLEKIVVYEEASLNTLGAIPGDQASRAVLMIDIEGGEFDLCCESFFKLFSNSIIFIELHDFFYPGNDQKLKNLISNFGNTHKAKFIKTSARDLSPYPELEKWRDIDRWMLCSEGRPQLMSWIRLDPINSFIAN